MDEPDFVVDETFEKYLPLATPVEDEMLEEEIRNDGRIKQPLVVWLEKKVLIDGHRRYALARAHKYPYTVEYRSFESAAQVAEWMIRNQLGRRNVTDHTRQILINRYYHQVRKVTGKGSAIGRAAKDMGVTERTVYRANQYVKALEGLTEEWKLLLQDIVVPRKLVLKLDEQPEDIQEELYKQTLAEGVSALRSALGEMSVEDEELLLADPEPTSFAPGTSKRVRIRELLKEADEAVEAMSQVTIKLYGDEGLSTRGSQWEARMRQSIRKYANVIEEIRNDRR